jgi:gliding motility-associated-like protein
MAAVCGLSKDINFSAYRSSTCNMPVKWYVKDANVPVKPLNDSTVNLQFSSAGQAWLFAEMPSECSIIKDSLLISVSDAANLELGSDVQLCQGDSAVFDAGSGFAEYLWSNGTTDQKLIVKSNGRFSCIGTAGNGCKSYDTVSMILKDCVPGFFMPNAFSPNHDGKNDVFKPNIGGVLLRYEFSIFNRWGQRIFTTKNRNAGWDGTQRNKTSDSEVFVWSCTYQFQGSSIKTEKGTVVIIR